MREAELTFGAMEQTLKDAVRAAVVKSVTTVPEDDELLETGENEMSQHLQRLSIDQDVGEAVVIRPQASRIDLELPIDECVTV